MSEPFPSSIVIVGAGQAGGEIAAELRQRGYTGALKLIGDEPHLPYKRPPLSKGFLAGTMKTEQLHVRPAATYEKASIEFIGDARAVRIDRAAKEVELADGRHISYDRLALATGGRPRPLPLPGADRPNVHFLRNIADVQKLQAGFAPGRRLVIVGGGYIGLEVAAVAVKAGLSTTVLEGAPRVLSRVTAPEISAFYERVHREAGVDLRTGVQIVEFAAGAGERTDVVLGSGERLEADLILVGIGLIPNTELAEGAGLIVDNGIVVDEYTRTSDPDIVAAGDCARHPSALLGELIRLESVHNAMEQGRCAAAALLGQPRAYTDVPWFWSDQYELKLQMVGLSNGYDQLVLRGDPGTRSFMAFYLREGRLVSADAVSRPQEFGIARKLVALRACIAPEILRDESKPLKELLPPAGSPA